MGRPRKANKHLPKRMYKDRKSGMYYFVDADGKYHRLGTGLSRAMAAYYEICPSRRSILTVSDLLDRYLTEISPNKASSTYESELKAAKMIRGYLGHFYPNEVTPVDVMQYLGERTKVAPVRVNRELSLLSEMFRVAPKWGVNTSNPVRDIKRNNESKNRNAKKKERYITDEQVHTFKTHAPLWLSLYVELKLLTGLRQTAMLSLQKSSITLSGFKVDDIAKGGGALTFEWTEELAGVIEKILALPGKSDSNYMFSKINGDAHNPTSFRSCWYRAMEKAEKHGLKRRFAERYLRNKAVTDAENFEQASKTVGHNSFKTTSTFYKMLGNRVLPFTFKQGGYSTSNCL